MSAQSLVGLSRPPAGRADLAPRARDQSGHHRASHLGQQRVEFR